MLIERPASDVPPPHPAGGPAGAVADPIEVAVAELRRADRAMARVLRAVADAGPAEGLPARRHVALRTGATRQEVAFLERTVQVLSGMPRVWAAFDDAGLSWSQVRAITVEARRLSVAQRGLLDEALAGALAEARDRGEPDRVVEQAGDLVARLDAAGQEQREAGEEREQRLVLQPDLDGGGEIHGYLGTHLFAVTATALDAAADAPVDPDAPPVTDADGRVLPPAAQPPRGRAAQLAEGLGRLCTAFLTGSRPLGPCTCGACDPTDGPPTNDDPMVDDDPTTDDLDADTSDTTDADVDADAVDPTGQDGPAHHHRPHDADDAHDVAGTTEPAGARPAAGAHEPGCPAGVRRRARPQVTIVASLADLLDRDGRDDGDGDDGLGVGSVVSRLLLRRGTGRRRITRALLAHLADDADLITLLTDDDRLPVAIGDSHAPISPALRRAVTARDQGCRLPGCSTPADWCDVHHVIPRERGGATSITNTCLVCRRCHVRLARHRWQMALHDDATLTVTIGRQTYRTRPRL